MKQSSQQYTVTIEHIRASGFIDALRGMRNPLESWDKNDTTESFNETTGLFVPTIGPNDLELAMSLAISGGPHAKFRRQIHVSFDLIAPWLFWKEYETYQVGTVENSTSQMFKMGSRFLTKNDFAFDNWGEDEINILNLINRLIQEWWDDGRKKKTPEWRKLMQFIPGAYKYRRTCTLNYEVLSNMYRWRKKHKLQEWRDFLIILRKTLPYPQLWTLEKVV